MTIHKNGYWEGVGADVSGGHYYDNTLADLMVEFFKNENVTSLVDLGCGDGKYVENFKKNGINACGYDGNPDTPEYTNNRCGVLDLSQPYKFEQPFDWVMSLEVGEHLPPQFEDIFIENLHNNNKNGIILSWAVEGQGGHGHFNERNNDYVKAKFAKLGYVNDVEAENKMRAVASVGWFRNTVMVFRK